MYFRLNIGVPELQIVDGPIPFRLTSDGKNVEIVIRAITEDDSDSSNLPYSVTCIATAEIKLSKTGAPVVEAIWQNLLPRFRYDQIAALDTQALRGAWTTRRIPTATITFAKIAPRLNR